MNNSFKQSLTYILPLKLLFYIHLVNCTGVFGAFDESTYADKHIICVGTQYKFSKSLFFNVGF